MRRLACLTAILFAACGGGNTMTDGGGAADGGGTPNDGGGTPTDGGGTPTDGGGTPTDGGVACANGTATLSDDCPFTACGGALDGTYCYTNVCLTRADVLPIDRTFFPGCSTADFVLSGFMGTARGSLLFATGFVSRNVELDVTGTLSLPAGCAVVGCGTAGMTLQQALSQATQLDTTIACSSATAGCSCSVRLMAQTASSDSYSSAGSTITLSTGRTYEYCAAGNTLSYRETTTAGGEPGVHSLTAQ